MQNQHTAPRQDSASLQKLPDTNTTATLSACALHRLQSRGMEGKSEGQSLSVNAALRNKSLWHQQSPKEHFPSCSEQGPAGVLLTAPCKTPPRQPRAAAAASPSPQHGAQRWTQLPGSHRRWLPAPPPAGMERAFHLQPPPQGRRNSHRVLTNPSCWS